MARWDKIGSRGRVEDRRGMAPVAVGGGIGAMGIMLVVAVAFMSTPEDALQVLDVMQDFNQATSYTQTVDSGEFSGEDSYETFAATVLGSNNDLWANAFAQNDLRYQEPTLVLFRQATQSGCGGANSQVGPHYCSLDGTIYLDETFFEELTRRFGARGGDVAEAYVIAHEVGHHVQNLLGIAGQVLRSRSNDLMIKMELQADCMAGMWAYSIREADVFEPNEILEAIDAAAAVGDDHIQKTVTGHVNPDTWTHGSSEQRKNWFMTGYKYGDFGRCDTFSLID